MTALFDLNGKRILLVGATGVLGNTFSRVLADNGAILALADLPATNVRQLANELNAFSAEIDVANEASVVIAINEVAESLGGLDGVVANAAVTSEGLQKMGDVFAPLESYPVEIWRHVLDVNLTGTFLVAREAGRIIKAGGGGSVVITSSIYGVVGPDHRIYEGQQFRSFPGYSASKAGVLGLVRWLATHWAEDGVRVNALSPGGVYNGQPDDFVSRYADRTPMGRMANPDDIVGALLFLLSDSSSYCTGQNILIDGGLSSW